MLKTSSRNVSDFERRKKKLRECTYISNEVWISIQTDRLQPLYVSCTIDVHLMINRVVQWIRFQEKFYSKLQQWQATAETTTKTTSHFNVNKQLETTHSSEWRWLNVRKVHTHTHTHNRMWIYVRRDANYINQTETFNGIGRFCLWQTFMSENFSRWGQSNMMH